MKKFTQLLLVLVFSLAVFTGCSSTDSDDNMDITNPDTNINDNSDSTAKTYQDGTYKAEVLNATDGYKDFVEITVKNGKIDKVVYDGKNETGKLKTEDEDFKTRFEAEFKTYPAMFMPMYAEKLVEMQSVDMIEPVTGAETDSEVFKKLANAALYNAKIGERSTAVVDIAN